jgi:hypothetical protein
VRTSNPKTGFRFHGTEIMAMYYEILANCPFKFNGNFEKFFTAMKIIP